VTAARGGGTRTSCVRVAIIVRLMLRQIFGVVIVALTAIAMVSATALGVMAITSTITAIFIITIAWMEDDDFLGSTWLTDEGEIRTTNDRDRPWGWMPGGLDRERRRRWMKCRRPSDISIARRAPNDEQTRKDQPGQLK
jgi:hypothetical protein